MHGLGSQRDGVGCNYRYNGFMIDNNGDRTDFVLKTKTPVMDDLRVVDMYNDAVGDGQPMNKRLWAQEFYKYSLDAAEFVATQFEDKNRFRKDLEKLNNSDDE